MRSALYVRALKGPLLRRSRQSLASRARSLTRSLRLRSRSHACVRPAAHTGPRSNPIWWGFAVVAGVIAASRRRLPRAGQARRGRGVRPRPQDGREGPRAVRCAQRLAGRPSSRLKTRRDRDFWAQQAR